MKWLERCLTSIPKIYEVIIVDNNSSDGTVDFIEKYDRDIILMKEPENLGFGQANNKGISYALNHGADHVFLLNQDAYLVDDTLERLVDFQIKNPDFGILSAIHTNAEVTRLDRNFYYYIRYDVNSHFYSDHVLGRQLRDVYEVPFINAAGWLVSKTCLMTVGGFDPIFFHYGEDENYCHRVLYHNYKIGVLPNAFMIHDREDRSKPNFEKFSEGYFKKLEISYKTRFCDVNDYQENRIEKKIQEQKRQLLKAYINLSVTSIEGNRKQLRMLQTIVPDVIKSVKLNQLEQPNYLHLENIDIRS
jgi:GT2 family glycosyltransferase